MLPIASMVFAGVFGVVSAAAGEAAETQESSAGAGLYAANCAGCHQPEGEGLPDTFPPLAGNPSAADADYVATVITDGRSGPIDVLGVRYDGVMPPIGGITPDEVAAIADHVVDLATGAPGSATPDTSPDPDEAPVTSEPSQPPVGDADRGRDRFVGSIGFASRGTACASCHAAGDVGMAGGRGLGPDLTDVERRLGGEAGLTAWLANPASPTMRPVYNDRPLTDEEIADLAAFLADAPERDRPSDAVDWLSVVGAGGLALLLGVMAIAFRGRRRPYAQTLAAKAATTRSAR